MMQALGRKYVSFFNFTSGRTGTLWDGRYKSCLVGSNPYVLACYRYIELNPVRAGIVASPGDYRWSSFSANGNGKHDPLVTAHPAYAGLSDATGLRCAAYLTWMQMRKGCRDEESIRLLTSRQRAFGDEEFRSRLEREHARPMGPLKMGRPCKQDLAQS